MTHVITCALSFLIVTCIIVALEPLGWAMEVKNPLPMWCVAGALGVLNLGLFSTNLGFGLFQKFRGLFRPQIPGNWQVLRSTRQRGLSTIEESHEPTPSAASREEAREPKPSAVGAFGDILSAEV